MSDTLQNSLPGGRIGVEKDKAENHNRWVRRNWTSDEDDTKLERTSLRWQGAWYVLTWGHMSQNRRTVRKAVRRSGPYSDIADAEARIAREAGTNRERLQTAQRRDERQSAIDGVMREGLVQRLYDAANIWTLVTGARQETLASSGRDIGAAWERQAVLDFRDNSEFPDLGALHNTVVEAAETYRHWRER